ncbi:MAG TPA: hypothetical protein VFH61_05845, partial [Thermoleophilia bacterium]|nr:hypothetical protein [Thermoleophilia bacterium]
ANGQPLVGNIVFTACTAGGDEFANTGNEIVLVRGDASWTVETAQIEGVPSGDSGRDGTSLLAPGAVGAIAGAGPFLKRNWNAAGVAQVTYPGGVAATSLSIAVVRFR